MLNSSPLLSHRHKGSGMLGYLPQRKRAGKQDLRRESKWVMKAGASCAASSAWAESSPFDSKNCRSTAVMSSLTPVHCFHSLVNPASRMSAPVSKYKAYDD